jgi:hypothetical protein
LSEGTFFIFNFYFSMSPIRAHSQNADASSEAFLESPSPTGQELWDELLNAPQSDALLARLIEEAKQEEAAGNFDEEDW